MGGWVGGSLIDYTRRTRRTRRRGESSNHPPTHPPTHSFLFLRTGGLGGRAVVRGKRRRRKELLLLTHVPSLQRR